MGMDQYLDFLPWYAENQDEGSQQKFKNRLRANGSVFGRNCFISPLADIYDARLNLDDDCVIGAHALIRVGDITAGRNCSINSYAYLQGNITLGNDVRIAPRANLIADNHCHDDIFAPITGQGNYSKGIRVGDDVWIGTDATIVDGVHIGSHSIVGAGSVVTKDVPDYCIVGGNPARVLKNRIQAYFNPSLTEFGQRVRDQLPDLLASHKSGSIYTDTSPQNQPAIRAACDAAELRAMFDISPDTDSIETIRAAQTDTIDYTTLCIGYALEVLPAQPLRPWPDLRGERLLDFLERQLWNSNAWNAGHQVDCLGTAMYQNLRHFGIQPDLSELFSWLDSHADPETGMWGKSTPVDMVNGFYRLTRGTYAQFDRPLPYPERSIDTILSHAADPALFGENAGNACNVLDIIHPLWLCKKQTDYRYAEGREIALGWIRKIPENWVEGKGFDFELCSRANPSLMGTEIWLSILYLLCDYVGIETLLDYCPQGVHRTESIQM